MEVHRCRFIEWVPSPVETIAFSRDGTNVAVGRESGDLEVWTVCQESTRDSMWHKARVLIVIALAN